MSELPNNPTIVPSSGVPMFRYFCQKVLPAVYDDSLSYYELLCKMTYKLNEVITTQNTQVDAIKELQSLYVELKNYVDNYFTNLDVQTEINNKLDQMAQDGTLEKLINIDILNNKLDKYTIKTTNTITEIQEILNINKPKIIIFEKGTYNLSNTLHLNKDTIINLNDSTLNFSVEYAFFNFISTDEFLEYEGNSNIRIYNGTIAGGSISFCHAKNIKFTNVNFENCITDHIMQLMAINNCIIDSCKFEGIILQESDRNYTEMIQLDDSLYVNFPYFDQNNPTYDNTVNQNITIKNCYFSKSSNTNYSFYTAFGMHSSNEEYMHKNINFINNELVNMENCGLNLLNCENVNICNNVFFKNIYETTSLGGGMIRLRQRNKNYNISNNIFNGNISALQLYGTPVLNEDIKVCNNIFKNYTNDILTSVMHISNATIEISNNKFENFSKPCIRLNPTTDLNDKVAIIKNNEFITDSNYNDNVIKCYSGKLIIENNLFDVINIKGKIFQFNETYDSIIMFKNNITNYIESDNMLGGANLIKNFNNLYDKKIICYNGNNNSLTNQIVKTQGGTIKFTEFNRCEIVLGSSLNTIQFVLKPWDIYKLSPRTYLLPVVNNSKIEYVTFTINENNTFNYNGNVPLRNVILYNE